MTYSQFGYLDSGMVGPYYPMMCRLGYPQLDIQRFDDGEWAILEYLKAPLTCAHTPWRYVGVGFRHVEITEAFVKRWIEEHDPMKGHIFRREEEKSAAIDAEHAAFDRYRDEVAERAAKAITHNPDLMERVARNGLHEIDLSKIARHIRPQQLRELARA